MGQAPTRPFDNNTELLCHTNMDISHLPDLSPFPRQPSHSSAHKAERATRPPAYRSRSKSSQPKSSSGRSIGKQERRLQADRKTIKKDHRPERRATKERGWKVVQETAREEPPAPSLPALQIIPRIDIVESSPIMKTASQTSIQPAPTPISLPRSPSLPALLPALTSVYAEAARPALCRPCTSPAVPLSPRLPLPGTPVTEEPLIQLFGFDGADESSPWIPAPYEGQTSSSSEAGEEQLSQSHDSIVTQQIRILRVTNPDPKSAATTRSQTPQPNTVPSMTLAEKRNVSVPASLRIVAQETPQCPSFRNGDRLFPTTPTSADSSTIKHSSDPSSPSTAVTSAPASPAKAKPPTGLGLSTATLAVPRPADRFRAASTPVPQLAPTKAGRRASGSALGIGLPPSPTKSAGQSRRASYQSRARSNSHESSDGDRSGTCSSASGISEGGRDRNRKHRKKKGRPSAVKVDDPASPLVAEQPTSMPALVALPLSVPKSPVPPVSETFQPPRSPRPPNTPRLGAAPQTERAIGIEAPALTPPEIPYALPPASPLKMDWFTTDLLVRCGIQPTSLAPIPATKAEVVTPFLSHPASLQPRAASPAPSYSPAPGLSFPLPRTPLGLEFPASMLSAPTFTEQVLESSGLFPVSPVRSEPETPKARRERKKAEKAARYEAFQKLAQMAVESPNNPFVDVNGAVRLGEYKRGQTDREIWKWCRNVRKAVAEEKQEKRERRKASADVSLL